MEAIVTNFVAAAAAEWGDKTQIIVALLAASSRRPLTVLLGLLAAAAFSSALAAFAGIVVSRTLHPDAMTLMVALALLFAGAAGFIRRRLPSIGSGRAPVLLTAFLLCLAAEVGDRTQFLTFALSGRFGSPALAAAGATAGILAAAIPAALAGRALIEARPARTIRIAAAILFLISGFVTAIAALGLS